MHAHAHGTSSPARAGSRGPTPAAAAAGSGAGSAGSAAAAGAQFAGFRLSRLGGVPFLWLPEPRFKTFSFALHLRRPLDERAAARAVLPALLLQGTTRDPGRPALVRRMEYLYGAAVVPHTSKVGESQVLRCVLDCVSGSCLPGEPDQLGPALELLADIVTRPRLEEGAFPQAAFAREQRNAANAARALFDNKDAWASQQAIAAACAGEPFATPEHGGVEALEALTARQPEAARQDFLVRGERLAIAMGLLPDADRLEARVGEWLASLPAGATEPVPPPVEVPPRPRRSMVERARLQQSKLVLLARLPQVDQPRLWVGRGLFASMLGGGPHSRLFREVREKMSLAYSAHAALERQKALLTVHVGLDEAAAERVEAETMAQAARLQAGDFTDEELETARAGLLSALASVDDSIGSRAAFTVRQWLLGQDRSPEQQAALYRQATRDDVVAGAAGLWLDHSYLLAPLGAAEGR